MTANHTTSSSPRILIVGPAWVGDMVMAQSLFMVLKQRTPSPQIDLLAPDWTFPLLERMPQVTEAIAMPLGHGQLGLGARIKLGRQLRSHHYDQAIVLPNSWKSALIPWIARIPLRTGYLGEQRWILLNDHRRLDKTVLTQTVQRFVALADSQQRVTAAPHCPTPTLQIDADQQSATAARLAIQPEQQPVLALAPGAEYGPAKRWPARYYAEVAAAKLAQGWAVWLFGSDNDRSVTAEINRAVDGQCRDFAGTTSLTEAVDLLAMANALVTNDSGLMHIGAALGIRVIALYGSSDPVFTPPMSDLATIITLNLDCSPCFKRDCPLGHTRCLSEIEPQGVLELLE